MKKKKIWIWVVIIAVIVVIACIVPSTSESGESSEVVLSESNIICNYNEFMEGWEVEINGIIQNKTKSDYSYVSVEFSLYDASGNNLGTAMDNMNNLGAGESWSFKAVSFDWFSKEVKSYKLAEIIYW